MSKTINEGEYTQGDMFLLGENKKGGEVLRSIEESVAIPCVPGSAFFEAEGGATKNMGNYECIRFSVRVRLPFDGTDEQLTKVKERNFDLVEGALLELATRLQ